MGACDQIDERRRGSQRDFWSSDQLLPLPHSLKLVNTTSHILNTSSASSSSSPYLVHPCRRKCTSWLGEANGEGPLFLDGRKPRWDFLPQGQESLGGSFFLPSAPTSWRDSLSLPQCHSPSFSISPSDLEGFTAHIIAYAPPHPLWRTLSWAKKLNQGMWGSMRKEGALKSRTGFWPKGWAGLLMLSQTIRLSVFGLPSVANFSITFCRLPPPLLVATCLKGRHYCHCHF